MYALVLLIRVYDLTILSKKVATTFVDGKCIIYYKLALQEKNKINKGYTMFTLMEGERYYFFFLLIFTFFFL